VAAASTAALIRPRTAGRVGRRKGGRDERDRSSGSLHGSITMHSVRSPEPRSVSTPITSHYCCLPRIRDGRAGSLLSAASGLVLGAAFLACGGDPDTGSGGAANGAGTDNALAPMDSGGLGGADTGESQGGTSSPATSSGAGVGAGSEGIGPIAIDTPPPGDDGAPPSNDATPMDDPAPTIEEPPVGAEPDGSLIGFASVAAAGLDTTTGGEGGEVVTVTTFEDLERQIASSGARVVQVQGTIASPDESFVKLRVGSNKTIIGLGADATLEHIGFDVTGWGDVETGTLAEFCEPEFEGQFAPVSNVIIRNLTFRDTLGSSSDADGIVVQCYAHHVWIDHNTFLGAPSGNDGAIDIKRGADWVTVSWNHLQAWDKSMLLGHDDANGEQDRGTLHVTYHHNYFENTRQRHPRIRFAHAHLLNNYLFNDASVANRTASYFLVAGVESNVHADGNLIEHAREIYVVGEESSSDALLTFADSNRVVQLNPSAEALFQIESNGLAFDPASFYPYAAEDAAQLATTVPAFAGAGKL
jgi:pectate lyase